MHDNKSNTLRFFLLFLSCFKNMHISAMQSNVKAKRDFDEALFQQQLNRLPQDIQLRCIAPLFWKHSPKIKNQEEEEIDTRTIIIDHRLLPAILSLNCIPALKDTFRNINFSRKRGYYQPGRDLEIYQISGNNKILSQSNIDFFKETQFIRDNPNKFVVFGYANKIEFYIHASHIKKLVNLTTEQLSFISDLYRAHVELAKKAQRKSLSQVIRPKIILNESQARLFYSLPLDIQRNLKMNYRLAASTKAQLAVKAPRVSAGLSRLSRTYTQYDHKPLVQLAKIAMKAGFVYYGLKWAASSKMLQGRNVTLLKLLSHRKKFILGTAVLIVAKDAYGPTVAKCVNRKIPMLGLWARKISNSLKPPLM